MSTQSVSGERAQEYAFLLGAEFPADFPAELPGVADAQAGAQFEICAEPDASLARVSWEEWIALFPQTEAAAQRLRVVTRMMPHLRGFVSPSVPIWERSSVALDWRRQWAASRRLEGRPLQPSLINDQNRERLVRGLASFFHELHGFSVERARGLGLSSARAWREECEALSRQSLALLRPRLSWSQFTWARRWWRSVLEDDTVWQGPPSVVHGGITVERLLVDTLVQQLTAVDGWHGLRVGDPALDFASLVNAYGTELTWRIVEVYGELGSTADAGFFRRIRLQQQVQRFRAVVRAAERDGAESESMTEALRQLR